MVLYPSIHAVSAFHDFEMMRQLIMFGVDMNLQNVDKDGCTPLIYMQMQTKMIRWNLHMKQVAMKQ